MTAPVVPALPATRPAHSSGADRSGSDGSAFASALDGALSAGRDTLRSPASERGVGREEAHRRNEERAGDRADRRAGHRAHHRGRAERAEKTDTPAAADAATPADDATPAPDAVPPPSVWALLLGGPVAAPPAAGDTTPTADGVAAISATQAAASPSAPAEPVPAAVPGPAVPDLPVTAAPPATAPTATAAPQDLSTSATPAPVAPTPTPSPLGLPPGLTVVTVPADAPAAPTAPATATTPATTPAAGPAPDPAAPAAPALVVPHARTASGDTAGSRDRGQGSSQDGVPAPDTAAPTTGAGLQAQAPIRSSAPAAAAAPVPAPQQPMAAQVAGQMAVLRNAPDGSSTMTLVLTPESLGPVHVSVTVTDGTVDLTLRGAHEHGRAALVDALPDLRRDLQSAGLTCSRLDVDRDTGGSWSSGSSLAQQHTPGERGGSSGRGEARPAPWHSRPPDAVEPAPNPAHSHSASPGVDVRV